MQMISIDEIKVGSTPEFTIDDTAVRKNPLTKCPQNSKFDSFSGVEVNAGAKKSCNQKYLKHFDV